MTKDEISKINMVRLTEWQQVLKEKHATVFAVIAIGHDHVEGKVIVMVPEDLDRAELKSFLKKSLTVLSEEL